MNELVGRRTRNSKTFQDEVNPRKFSLDASIGAIHYKDNPQDETEQWKDIDNTFEPASPPWNWQMLEAGYHVRVLEDFSVGQIIEFEKQGEYVRFQPMALQYSNGLDQIQPIAMPQDAVVGVEGNKIKWTGAYGEGLDFSWQCSTTRLLKLLTIDRLDRLPAPEQYILDGGNPVLELNLIFDPSKDIDAYVDGGLWDKKTRKETATIVEWRKGGEVLFGFMPLRYWGSGEPPVEELPPAIMRLSKAGNSLYISIRVPYSWVQNAEFPIYIDTDVDEIVEAGADDGGVVDFNTFITAADYGMVGFFKSIPGNPVYAFYRFASVTICSRATIDVATVSLYRYTTFNTGSPLTKIYAQDEADPAAPTSKAELDADRADGTTAKVDWDGILDPAWNEKDILSVIQELYSHHDYSSGAAILILHDDDGSDTGVTNTQGFIYWEFVAEEAAKLHIEYTAGASPEGNSLAAKMIAGNLI